MLAIILSNVIPATVIRARNLRKPSQTEGYKLRIVMKYPPLLPRLLNDTKVSTADRHFMRMAEKDNKNL